MAGTLDDMQWRAWKTQLVPLLYDWFSNHNLMWPSQACRWGRQLEELPYKTRHRIYYSEQTNPELAAKEPPKLLVAEAEVPKPRVAPTELVSTWTEMGRCPFVRDVKTIVHPGEVNKIRELPQRPDVVVTHTDAAELYVWNTASQPNMVPDQGTRAWGSSVPELTLTGHKAIAQFPLATASNQPMVASGGTDKLVLLWDLCDAAASGGALGPEQQQTDAAGEEQQQQGPSKTTHLAARQSLSGHTDTVEDVVFKPGSSSRLVSVGDDKQVLFWDATAGNRPVAAIKAAHGSGPDVHCVDWSALEEHLVVTGAADGSLKVWDLRKLPPPSSGGAAAGAVAPGSVALKAFTFHSDAIMRVEWSPHSKGILASGGEDHLVVVWSMDKGAAAAAAAAAAGGSGASSKAGRGSKAKQQQDGEEDAPPEVLFKHIGHRDGKVVDFQWCPSEPWTLLSVSEAHYEDDEGEEEGGDEGSSRGGGTLQIWRLNDLVYRPEEEVLQELEAHKEWILHGRKPPEAVLQHIDAQEQAMMAGAQQQEQQQQQQQQAPESADQKQQQQQQQGTGQPVSSGGAAAAAAAAGGAGGSSGSEGSGGGAGVADGAQEQQQQQQQQQQPGQAGAEASGDAASTQPMEE